jgi:hypothetical protein
MRRLPRLLRRLMHWQQPHRGHQRSRLISASAAVDPARPILPKRRATVNATAIATPYAPPCLPRVVPYKGHGNARREGKVGGVRAANDGG